MTKSAEDYLKQGNEFFKKGEFDKAIVHYTEAIRFNRDYASAYYNRSKAHEKKGNYEKAREDYDQAIYLNPEYANEKSNKRNNKNNKGRNESKYNDIFDAMKSGTLNDVKNFISENALRTDFVNNSGNNMLHLAVLAGKLDIVKYMISLGVNINVKNKGGGTPLYIAVSQAIITSGKIDTLPIIKCLIYAGADLNIEYFDGQNILLTALKFSANSAIIKLLVSNGADVDIADNENNQSALHTTAEYIELDNETMKLIVSKSGNIDLQDTYGNTPLHQTCMVGNVNMAKLLLSHGANINKKSNNQSTPLHVAVASGQIESIKYLISKGANVDAKGEDNWTPLHWAAQGGSVEIARILVDAGADVNAKTYKGSTALMMARQFGHSSLETYLSSRTYY